MTYINDNVIPGNHGKKFSTDVKSPEDKSKLINAIMRIDGVTDVFFDTTHPYTVIIHTNKVVHVSEIQEKATQLQYHMIAKGPFFPLF